MKTKLNLYLDLNPAERLLINRLPDALLLEKSLTAMRQKYDELWARICEKSLPELTFRRLHAIHDEQVGMGKQQWAHEHAGWPSGFYVYGIDFNHFCHEDEDAPQIGVWIKPPRSARVDLDDARDQVRRLGQRIFGAVPDEPREAAISLWWRIPETRQELLQMIAHKSGRRFVNVMMNHLRSLRPLIPVIDRIFKATNAMHGRAAALNLRARAADLCWLRQLYEQRRLERHVYSIRQEFGCKLRESLRLIASCDNNLLTVFLGPS